MGKKLSAEYLNGHYGPNKKKCSVCKTVKDISEFTTDKAKRDGFRTDCCDCKNKKRQAWRKRTGRRSEPTKEELKEREYWVNHYGEGLRKCRGCDEIRPIGEYKYKSKLCVSCNPRKRSTGDDTRLHHYLQDHKKCSKCGEIKNVSEFIIDKTRRDGHYVHCKKCKAKTNTKYRRRNKDKVKEYAKKYYQENKGKLRAYSREYGKTEKARAKSVAFSVAYNRKRRKNDPRFRLRHNVSKTIGKALKKKTGVPQTGSKWAALNYQPEDLVQHFEAHFYPDMSWDNYGRVWVIDHVIPDSWFEYESIDDLGFKQSWAIDNLRPCYKEENESKSNLFAGTEEDRISFEELREQRPELCLKEEVVYGAGPL